MPETVRGRRWDLRPAVTPATALVRSYPPLIARLLAAREVRSPEEAGLFFGGGCTTADPLALSGMPDAVRRIIEARERGELVTVYGDYDVDGVTATAILSEGLRELGVSVSCHIPDRFTEGYGLTREGVEAVAATGATLIISVDCGINANTEIAYAKQLGVDVVVLDHHEPPETLPEAAALVDPKLGGGPRDLDGLASCGLTLTVLRALCAADGRPLDESRYLDLAALGTVADMVPLTGENRRIVRDGLRAIAATGRPGLRALMALAGVDPAHLDADAIGFRLAPRLNAAGRLEHARFALDLLTTRDPAEAQVLAGRLSELNTRRQQMTERACALAGSLAGSECAGGSLVMVGHEEIAQGIVGLVASRLVEEYARPAIVYERGPEVSKGSVRGIGAIDVHALLSQGADLMDRWGGHAGAGGFTVRTERLPKLKSVLSEWTETQLAGADLRPVIEADLETPLGGLRGAEVKFLQHFQPCGQGNPTPTFISRGAAVMQSRTMGAENTHLRMKLRDGGATWEAVAWRMGHAAPRPGERVDLVYSVSRDRRGSGLELLVHDFCRSC